MPQCTPVCGCVCVCVTQIFGQNNLESHEETTENAVWLSPDDVLRQQWDLLMIFCVVYNCLVIPLRMAFGDENENLDALAFVDWFVDFLFLVDIYLNFHTGFDDDGIIMNDKQEVRQRYLRTWFGFDLIISLPIDLPFAFIGGNSNMRLYFRIPRLLRLLRAAARALTRPGDSGGGRRPRAGPRASPPLLPGSWSLF